MNTGPLDSIPNEIIDMLMQFLHPQEVIALRLVCREFLGLSQADALWRALLDRFFPVAKTLKFNEYQENPELFFRTYYNEYKLREVTQTLGMKVMLAALCGDENGIEGVEEVIRAAELEDEDELIIIAKQGLYAMAVANGHFRFLSKLSDAAKGHAYIEAIAIGYASVVEQLRLHITNAHLLAVDPEDDFSDPIEKAIMVASTSGHAHIALECLGRCSDEDRPLMICHAFRAAVRGGHHELIETYLQIFATFINSAELEDATIIAARNGHLFVFIELLKRCFYGIEIDPFMPGELKQDLKRIILGKALKKAVKGAHGLILFHIVKEHGFYIPPDDLFSGVKSGVINKRISVLKVLLPHVKDQLSDTQLFELTKYLVDSYDEAVFDFVTEQLELISVTMPQTPVFLPHFMSQSEDDVMDLANGEDLQVPFGDCLAKPKQ